MQYIVIMGLFGAFCLTIGYVVGSIHANIIKQETLRLLKKTEKAQKQLELLHEEIVRELIENGCDELAEQINA